MCDTEKKGTRLLTNKKKKYSRKKVRAVSNDDGSKRRFVRETLGVLDKYDEMKGYHFIMDNARFHKEIFSMRI